MALFTEQKAEQVLDGLKAILLDCGYPYSYYGTYDIVLEVQDNKLILVKLKHGEAKVRPGK